MPPEKGQTELEKLFEGLPDDEQAEGDIFSDQPAADPAKTAGDDGAAPAKGDAKTGDEPEEGGPRKNRRHRRMEAQLQKEREARIAAEARAAALAERPAADAGEVPQQWLQMYGDTPESRQAWALNKGILTDFMKQAEANAVKTVEDRQAAQRAQQQAFEEFISEELESIEDEFNVDVTSDAPAAKKARREFLELVQSLSPKDDNGQVTGYADFGESWKIYQDRKRAAAPDKTRNKEVAARGMVKSGDAAAAAAERPRTPGFFGWQKDLNING